MMGRGYKGSVFVMIGRGYKGSVFFMIGRVTRVVYLL